MGLIQRDHETVVAREQAQQQQVDFLQNQIQALRSAFTTLSEVIVSEMGAPGIVVVVGWRFFLDASEEESHAQCESFISNI